MELGLENQGYVFAPPDQLLQPLPPPQPMGRPQPVDPGVGVAGRAG